jgi:hypothetical protein
VLYVRYMGVISAFRDDISLITPLDSISCKSYTPAVERAAPVSR